MAPKQASDTATRRPRASDIYSLGGTYSRDRRTPGPWVGDPSCKRLMRARPSPRPPLRIDLPARRRRGPRTRSWRSAWKNGPPLRLRGREGNSPRSRQLSSPVDRFFARSKRSLAKRLFSGPSNPFVAAFTGILRPTARRSTPGAKSARTWMMFFTPDSVSIGCGGWQTPIFAAMRGRSDWPAVWKSGL